MEDLYQQFVSVCESIGEDAIEKDQSEVDGGCDWPDMADTYREAKEADRMVEMHGGELGEHPRFPTDAWKREVANNDTRLGYWSWVFRKKEEQGGLNGRNF